MKKIYLLSLMVFSLFIIIESKAASFDLKGQYRFGLNMANGLILDEALVAPASDAGADTSFFLENRFLLMPNVIVDDHFSIKSELIFLQDTVDTDAPSAAKDTPPSFGSVFSSNEERNALLVRKAWLDWDSDYGKFSVGRQGKSWGLGILYNDGTGVFDDYATIVDRVGFHAMLGNVGLKIGYDKLVDVLLNAHGDDVETFEVAINYNNPENETDVGLMWSIHKEHSRVVADPSDSNILGDSYHDVSFYAKKKWKKFEIGAEFVSRSPDDLDTGTGGLLQLDFESGNWHWLLEGAYASGGPTPMVLHANYKPLMILYRQTLGANYKEDTIKNAATAGVGSSLNGVGSGAILAKAGFEYSWSNDDFTFGTAVGYAQLEDKGAGDSEDLGIEVNMYLDQKWYDNFTMNYSVGMLMPGDAWSKDADSAWAFEIKGALKF